MTKTEQVIKWYSEYRKDNNLEDHISISDSNVINWLAEKEIKRNTDIEILITKLPLNIGKICKDKYQAVNNSIKDTVKNFYKK